MGCGNKESFKLMRVAVLPSPIQVRCVCRLVVNEMKPGDVYISPGIYRMAKLQLRRPSEEDCATSLHLKWGILSPNEVDRITQHVREVE